MHIPLYLVLCAGRAQFEIWQEFLMSISLYVVLGAGRAQFGILGEFLLPISLYVFLRAGHHRTSPDMETTNISLI